MCVKGRCVWKFSVVSKRFVCLKCENFISEREYLSNPNKYKASRFHATAFGGPLDGAELRLPFSTKRFWSDNLGSIILYVKEDALLLMQSLYEYEMEPLGDMVFVKLIERVIEKDS